MPSPESSIFLFHKPKGVVVTRSDELGRSPINLDVPSGHWRFLTADEYTHLLANQ